MDMNNQGYNPNDMNNGGYQPPMQNGMNNMPINNNQGKKKGSPLKIILPILAVVLLLIIVVVLVVSGGKGNENPTPQPENSEIVVSNEGTEDKEDKDEVVVDDDTQEEEPEDIEEPEVITFDYDDPMVGIKFNYASNLYSKPNTEEIFNTLAKARQEGKNEFNIYTDKLPNILNLLKLTTGDNDSLFVSISLLPFEIEKETTTLKINGKTEVKNESIAAINLTDEELITKYDEQIKATLAQSGCTIETYNESTVGVVGSAVNPESKLKGIFTSRVYTGPTEQTTASGKVDVLQCTIPVGKNAIVVTAVTDGNPIAIDKAAIFNEIVDSIVVITENPADVVVEETPAE